VIGLTAGGKVMVVVVGPRAVIVVQYGVAIGIKTVASVVAAAEEVVGTQGPP